MPSRCAKDRVGHRRFLDLDSTPPDAGLSCDLFSTYHATLYRHSGSLFFSLLRGALSPRKKPRVFLRFRIWLQNTSISRMEIRDSKDKRNATKRWFHRGDLVRARIILARIANHASFSRTKVILLATCDSTCACSALTSRFRSLLSCKTYHLQPATCLHLCRYRSRYLTVIGVAS